MLQSRNPALTRHRPLFAALAAVALVAHRFAADRGLALGAIAETVSAEEHGKLPEAQRSWYADDGKGGFKVDLAKITLEDTTGLRNAAETERQNARNAERARKELEKKYEGIDADEVRKILAKLDADDEGKMIKEGKIDDVFARRTEKLKAEHQKALAIESDKIKAEQQKTAKYQGRVLDNHIRAAASKAKVHDAAVEDVLLRARQVFTLDDEGNAVQRDKDGAVIVGKDGKTPYSPAEWIDSMQESAPHWFSVNNSGGGARGGGGGQGGQRVITRVQFDQMGVEQRAKAMKDGVKVVD